MQKRTKTGITGLNLIARVAGTCCSLALAGAAHAQVAATCTAAAATSVGPGTHAFDLRSIAAPNATPGAFCSGGDHQFEQWLSYTPTNTGRTLVRFDALVDGPATFTTVLDQFGTGGSCDNAGFDDLCQASDDECRPNGQRILNVTAGSPVLFRIAGRTTSKPHGNLIITENPTGPAGDECASAVTATLGVNSYTTVGSVVDGLPNNPGFSPDTWLVYTPTVDGGLEASVCGQAAGTGVALYSGCQITGVLDTGSFNDVDFNPCRAVAGVRAGVPVYIQVANSCGAAGEVTLAFTPGATPANDLCASAAPAALGNTLGDNTFAFTDGGDDCATDFGSGRDLWYRFTPATGGDHDFRVNYDFDGVTLALNTSALSLFTSCAAADPTGAITLACSNDGFSSSFFRAPLVAGTEYLVRVAGGGRLIDGTAYGRGEFNLNIRRVTPPANDDCANATVVGAGTFALDLTDASPDGQRPCPTADPLPDVWFSHTPTASGPLEIGMVAPTDQPVVDLSSAEITVAPGCGASPTAQASLAFDTQTGAALSRLIVQGVAGQPILIRVAGEPRLPFPAAGQLYIGAVRAPVPPANDRCENATLIGDSTTVPFSVASAGLDPVGCGPTPNCQDDPCTIGSIADVFFRYVSTRTGRVDIVVDDGAPYFANDTFGAGAVISVLGECGGVPTSCGLPCGDFPADRLSFDAVAGQTYLIRIGSYIGFPAWDDQGGTITITCPADFNGSGVRDVSDIFAFLSAWFADAPGADFNGSGTRDVADIFAFLSAWFAGC